MSVVVCTTVACQKSIEMFGELKQWVCWCPYLNSDDLNCFQEGL